MNVLSGVLLATCTTYARSNTFDVYCVPSVDGVSTCSGWEDGGILTCVSSTGGVASCGSSSGQNFTCTQDGAGVTTCQEPQKTNLSSENKDDCTYIGNGSFSCSKQSKRSKEMIPSPSISDESNSIPKIDLDTTIPSLIP